MIETLTELKCVTLKQEIHRSLENVCLKGEYKGFDVVVKRVIISRPDSLDKFEDEVKILCNPDISQAVVAPLAIIRAAPHYSIVLPFMELGSLNQLMEKRTIPLQLSLCLMLDSARALACIHEKMQLIHRDIKSGNILIDRNGRGWITDLGSAAHIRDSEEGMDWENNMQPTGGFHKRNIDGTTLGYTSPEIFRNTPATQASDIYSLAMTFAELLTGIPPFRGMEKEDADMHTVMDASYSEHALILAITNDHLRPGLVSVSEQPGMPMELIDMIRDMWHHDPSTRPSIHSVVEKLERICEQLNIDTSFGPARMALVEQTREKALEEPIPELVPTASAIPYAVHDVPLVPIENHDHETNGHTKAGERVKRNSRLPIGAFATSGRRGADKMEDRHSVTHGVSAQGNGEISVCTIFDGHGGASCAQYANALVGPALLTAMTQTPFPDAAQRKDAAVASFVETDRSFRENPATDKSGCTALAAALWHENSGQVGILLANAGDCRAVLCRNQNGVDTPIRLTRDHNAGNPSEKQRIEQLGSKFIVTRDGKARVQGHIQVTRALGDAAMKPFGVCAEPEITEFTLNPSAGDDFVVLATDGVWDTLSDQDVVNAVRNTAKECGLAAKRIGGDALARGSSDNISVIVIFLHQFDQHDDVVYVNGAR